MEDEINIVCATDDNFVQHCAVMICSLLENSEDPRKIKFFMLLTKELQKENELKITELVEKYSSKIDFVLIPQNYFSEVYFEDRYTKNALSRIFASEILQNIDKFIYLDCDLIVEGNISDLWNYPLNHHPVAAVHNIGLHGLYLWMNFERDHYFNSGVLLVDSKKFREDKIHLKALEFLSDNFKKLLRPDQQALNYALKENWEELPIEWNVLSHYFGNPEELGNYLNKVSKAIKKPKIIHFTGDNKPTDKHCTNPFRRRYYYYLNLTLFRQNIKDFEKKYLSINGLVGEKIKLSKVMINQSIFGKAINKVNKEVITQAIIPKVMENFDWEFYLQKNLDLANSGVTTREKAIEHYLKYGLKEKRIVRWKNNLFTIAQINNILKKSKTKLERNAKKMRNKVKAGNFDWRFYLWAYKDLRDTGVNNEEKAMEHYLKYGKDEGRLPCKKTDHKLNVFLKKPKHNITICAIMKNEAPYIIEWIAYHRILKTDNFLIYNNDSTDNTKDILQKLDSKGIITFIDWPSEQGCNNQLNAYQDALKRLKDSSEWITFLDTDEFIVPKKHKDLKSFLEDYPYADGIAISWKVFGSSGKQKLEDGLVMERFTKSSKEDFVPNRLFKTISRLNKTWKVLNPHEVQLKSNKSKYIFPDNSPFIGGLSEEERHYTHNIIQVNHYFTKSKEEWDAKRLRGQATEELDSPNRLRSNDYFYSHDRNEEEDKSILKYLEKTKEEIKKLDKILSSD